MKLKVVILLLLIFYYGSNACADSGKDITYWNLVLKEVTTPELKNIKIASEEDLIIFKDYGIGKRNGELIYQSNLEEYRNKGMFSYFNGDVNGNGKEDAILACVDTGKGISYLVILEKDGNEFHLIKYFPFKAKVFYIAGVNQYIDILFQAGTDWMEQVYWNGSDYVIKERDVLYSP
ncbi:MAG: hypothetical protein HY807_05715 [Nitrospirae bacterium]|nr:hypothetical protein [Nitrospirota bacterium]